MGLEILAVLVLAFYFVPAIIASRRRHRNAGSIFVLNLFLGWTFLGWVIALVWAFNDNVEPKPVIVRDPNYRSRWQKFMDM